MKKVLSFVLSVAMVICLMPAMAFADGEDAAPTTTATATGLSQFSDADSIKNKEAVAVLVGLGIVDGMGDGTFQPAGNLTRAQASKLVATLVKSGDKSEIPAPAADPFTDVSKSHWGAGAIKFGVDNGYINGMGDGTFHPEEQVTTAQLATMLDKLLGYSVADINYQWPENAMAKATIAGVLVGVTKGANDSLNRDEAAQMIFNALRATDQVKSTDTGSQDAVDGDTGYQPVRNRQVDDYRNPPVAEMVNGVRVFTEQLIEKYFTSVTLDSEIPDEFGRESTAWKNGTETITSEVLKEPVFVYTSHKTGAELKKDLSAYDFSNVTLHINNKNGIMPGEFDFENVAGLTDNGHLVELYVNEKGNAIENIVVATYLPVKVTSNKKGKIELEGAYADITDNDDLYDEVSSVKKNDYIMVATENVDPASEIIDAYVPEQVQGTVTKITTGSDPKRDSVLKRDLYPEDSSATIGGTEYQAGSYDQFASKEEDVINWMRVDSKREIIAYLDKYGYVAFWDWAEEKNDAADWGLLKAVYRTSSTNDYGEPSTDWFAQIVDENGEIQNFKLNYKDEPDVSQEVAITTNIVKNIIPVDSALNNRMTSLLVTYESGAKGYTLATTDISDSGKVISEGKDGTPELKTDDKKIGDAYIASDVKVITVKGEKSSKLEASAEDGIAKTIKTNYKYVVKNDGTNDLVKTIYIEKLGSTRSEDLIYIVDGNKGQLLYQNENEKEVTGTVVEYYAKDSQKSSTMIVSDPKGKGIDKGWYAGYDTDGEASVLDIPATANNGVVEEGTIVSIYGNTITINNNNTNKNIDYSIDDVAVRDTREDEDIASVDELTEAVKDAKDNEEPNLRVTFAYDTESDDDIKPITQLYLIEQPE